MWQRSEIQVADSNRAPVQGLRSESLFGGMFGADMEFLGDVNRSLLEGPSCRAIGLPLKTFAGLSAGDLPNGTTVHRYLLTMHLHRASFVASIGIAVCW